MPPVAFANPTGPLPRSWRCAETRRPLLFQGWQNRTPRCAIVVDVRPLTSGRMALVPETRSRAPR